jgi:hypothetical protein
MLRFGKCPSFRRRGYPAQSRLLSAPWEARPPRFCSPLVVNGHALDPLSLLERLRRLQDGAAWSQFVHLYTPLLFRWARGAGLPEADAADLLQDVFTTLL